MDRIVFGSFTVLEIVIAAVVIAGICFLWAVLKKALSEKKVPPHAQIVKCGYCGWQGQVSRLAGRCPRCNKPIGDQKAKEYKTKEYKK